MTMFTAKEAAKNTMEATNNFRQGLIDFISCEVNIRSRNRETQYAFSTEDLRDDDIVFLICEFSAAEYSFTVDDGKITLDWSNKINAVKEESGKNN